MKIYQIHEISGCYGDVTDNIVGTYLNKNKAEDLLEKLIIKEKIRIKQCAKCNTCPMFDIDVEASDTLSIVKAACEKHCDRVQIIEGPDGFSCENEQLYYDDNFYKIQEEEVIE